MFEAFVREQEAEGVVVRISGAKTRWGSCNAKRRSLMFNWRLALAPIEIARYVVVHEMVHLTHPNHSRQFWQAVAQRDPNFQEHRRWLKQHGHTLQFLP
jgi:predicted metal-dependent hydrolase